MLFTPGSAVGGHVRDGMLWSHQHSCAESKDYKRADLLHGGTTQAFRATARVPRSEDGGRDFFGHASEQTGRCPTRNARSPFAFWVPPHHTDAVAVHEPASGLLGDCGLKRGAGYEVETEQFRIDHGPGKRPPLDDNAIKNLFQSYSFVYRLVTAGDNGAP